MLWGSLVKVNPSWRVARHVKFPWSLCRRTGDMDKFGPTWCRLVVFTMGFPSCSHMYWTPWFTETWHSKRRSWIPSTALTSRFVSIVKWNGLVPRLAFSSPIPLRTPNTVKYLILTLFIALTPSPLHVHKTVSDAVALWVPLPFVFKVPSTMK